MLAALVTALFQSARYWYNLFGAGVHELWSIVSPDSRGPVVSEKIVWASSQVNYSNLMWRECQRSQRFPLLMRLRFASSRNQMSQVARNYLKLESSQSQTPNPSNLRGP